MRRPLVGQTIESEPQLDRREFLGKAGLVTLGIVAVAACPSLAWAAIEKQQQQFPIGLPYIEGYGRKHQLDPGAWPNMAFSFKQGDSRFQGIPDARGKNGKTMAEAGCWVTEIAGGVATETHIYGRKPIFTPVDMARELGPKFFYDRGLVYGRWRQGGRFVTKLLAELTGATFKYREYGDYENGGKTLTYAHLQEVNQTIRRGGWAVMLAAEPSKLTGGGHWLLSIGANDKGIRIANSVGDPKVKHWSEQKHWSHTDLLASGKAHLIFVQTFERTGDVKHLSL